jgi:glyoxylase-like metal-dependent hydrolase (beta-lactamase superfamily II)
VTLPIVHTLDLNFQGIPNTIGVFLLPHQYGAALVECGPGSTIPNLRQALAQHGLTPNQITDVFLTHIHLDHAGSAGWWARQGATIHVHTVGAPHMVNPEKLLASAGRIYGDQMGPLWGEFLPVPQDQLNILHGGETVQTHGLSLSVLDTPGHANHHLAYLLDGICFSGDVGGVHMQGIPAVRLPTVPPEFDPGLWRASLDLLGQQDIRTFATTHFGLHPDAGWHLSALYRALDEIEAWMETTMPAGPSRGELRQQYATWMHTKAQQAGLTAAMIGAYDVAISSQMSADGIYRYWHKTHPTSSP